MVWPSLLTSFGRSEMKSLWNWGSMTCIMCRTWVGSQIWISSSTAIRRSALLHIYRTKFTLLRHLPPTSIFSYQFWYSINKIVTNINNYTWNVCSHSMSLGGGCSLDGILGRWPPAYDGMIVVFFKFPNVLWLWMGIRHKIFIESYKKSVNTYYHETRWDRENFQIDKLIT